MPATESTGPGTESTEDEHSHDHGTVNEHVWYDLPTVDEAGADRVATAFGAAGSAERQPLPDTRRSSTRQVDG